MNIGIIGAGHLGLTLARHLANAGHLVGLSNSRGPDSLIGSIGCIGPNARALSVEQAAEFGQIVILAVPWRKPEALPAAQLLRGKFVIDAMNAYDEAGEVIDLGPKTSSEEVARRLPEARIVKAFNTLYYHTLATESREREQGRLVVFVAGDDSEAKSAVSQLIAEIGFAPVDTGNLRDGGRKQQPGSPIYNRALTVQEARELLVGLYNPDEARGT